MSRQNKAARSLRIAVVAHVRHPIAEPFMGGMEAHSWHLCRALRDRGHDVTLFAAGDSDAGVALRPVLPRHYEATFPWQHYRETERLTGLLDRAHGAVLDELRGAEFDVIHNNALHRYVPRLARRDRVPCVTSLHIPPFDVLERTIKGALAPWNRVTLCSEAHARTWWAEDADRPAEAHVVPNGIDLDRWPFRPEGDGSAVWIGRISATKGPELAIEAARRAGVRLRLFGVIDDPDFHAAEVVPRLGGEVTYEGARDAATLAREIGRASVLLFTPTWPEPFGLVAAEAMACGLPVAAFDIGAAREVVGEAGALAPAGDVDALAAVIGRAMEVPRTTARARAEARFSHHRMVRDYEALYAQVIAAVDAPAPEIWFRPVELPPDRTAALAG
ncbi:glycosyltransferase family 4 protein [Roseivivax marinus]|uniref:glycosyltransferase family 4 protein n=1 Tax=Roseivivax marinus TaxID=1379903 RepID=UPI00273DAA33|nr:glycosyltransferase family 4 protein [Roseivivax marinus]